jgi:glycosyltransferase involved in cell wall biosynthesis
VFVAHNARFKPEMADADMILAVSEPVAAAARARFPGTPVELVENFGKLQFSPVRAGSARPLRIGALGRLHPNKGFDLLVEAAALMRDRQVQFTLDIAGEGEERGELEARIARHGLQDVVRLPGWTDAPAAFLAGLDLFVLPSRVEPFGLVLVEAMAAGTPIVSTDIDGPGQILRGDLGVLTPPEDPVGLAYAISGALADRAGSRKKAETAQAVAKWRFGFEAGARRLTGVLSAFDPAARTEAA